MVHKFINSEDILTTVTSEPDCDVIIASGAWGDHFMDHFIGNIQRNHKLCRDRVQHRYEYVFYTTKHDYEKYKDKFIDPDITFIFMDNHAHPGGMNGVQIDYASKRGKRLILMASDCLHTPNLIPNLLTKYADKDAVCVMSQRMFPEILSDIKSREAEVPYETIFEPREFLKLCLPRLHQRERRYFMDSYRLTGTYGSLMFPVRKDGVLIGILIRSFHLGYICINKPVVGLCGGYLDSNGFVGNLTSPENVGMVVDSDNGFCVDVTFDRNDNGEDDAPILTDLSQITKCWQGWKGQAVHPVNESLMGFNIAVHSEPLNQEWIELANKADSFVTNIYGGAIGNKPLTWEMLE